MIWRVEHLATVDSTNSRLAEAARHGVPEGHVIIADYQSAGRGRLDRTWLSVPGSSFLCSILLRPALSPQELQLAVVAVALAARAALVRLSGVRPQLKWPNDLVVDDVKLGGLLAELIGGTTNGVVVGVGINLTSTPPDFVATCVRDLAGVTITPLALLDLVLEELEPRRMQLDSEDGRQALRTEYQSSLCTLGRVVKIELFDRTVVGHARSVDPEGRLEVEVDGSSEFFSAGDVVHLRIDEGSTL